MHMRMNMHMHMCMHMCMYMCMLYMYMLLHTYSCSTLRDAGWRASTAARHKFLHQAVGPREEFYMIPEVCDACSFCRFWASPVVSTLLTTCVVELVERGAMARVKLP